MTNRLRIICAGVLIGLLSTACAMPNRTMSDAAPEVGPDARMDVVQDALPDASPDAFPDASPDALPDALPDAATDAPHDASPDASPDALPDASPDALPDAATDAPHDAMTDADSGTPCSASQMLCGTSCVDLQSDSNNCGSCGRACAESMACRAGDCHPVCTASQMECADGCRNVTNDTTNCGACGVVCSRPPFAYVTCTTGTCGFECYPHFGDCDGDPANGCETNLQSDNRHCGACAVDCGATALCSMGSCRSSCAPTESYCNGSCVDVTANPSNCGSCGHLCASAPRASATCVAGSCDIACDPGFGDCDGLRPNGCETNLTSNVSNCGGCALACPVLAHSAPLCTAGVCGSACIAGWGDCDGNAADGCETNFTNSVTHCGGCGTVCPTPANATATCVASGCGFACNAGFADCDGDAANGCEANLAGDGTHCGSCGTACPSGMMCSGGHCEITCMSGETNCGGSCFDLAGDPQHCGACGTACPTPINGNATCTASVCGVACNAGYGNCNGTASDGCEVNLASDSTNCGACGAICPAGTMCTSGRCEITCLAGQTACAGSCFDLASDPQHCGACGTVCPPPVNGAATCTASACGVACNAGYGDCNSNAVDGCEVNLASDSGNCGACGAVCGTGTSCVAGHCQLICSAPTALCSGACADLTSDPANCGTCGVVCGAPANSTATCAASVCGSSCNAGFGDCDRNVANGCETDIAGSVANCGACGRACAVVANAVASCAAGTCAENCNAGFADCDGIAFTGCDTNVTSGVGATLQANCGACGVTCVAPAACASGGCTTCSMATAGLLAMNATVTGTLAAGTTGSRISTLSCMSTPGTEDVWTLTVTATSVVQLTTSGGLDTVLAVRRNCGVMTSEMACNNDIVVGNPNSQITVTLAPGDYSVIVDQRLSAGGTYTLTSSAMPLASTATNTDCDHAALLDASGLTSQLCSDGGAASNACPSISVNGSSLPYPGPQLFYAVDIPAGQQATITATPSGAPTNWKPVVRVLDRCYATQCMAGTAATTAGTATSVTIDNPDSTSHRYFVSVANGTPTVSGSFDLSLTFAAGATALTNASCATSQSVTPTTPALAQTIGSATDLLSLACTNAGSINTPGRMLYYNVAIPAYTTATIRMVPTGFDAVLQLLPSCGSSTCLASANTGSSGVQESVVFRNNGPATTVVVGAGSQGYAATGTFNLTVAIAPYGELPIPVACDDMSAAPSLGITADDAVTANAALPFAFTFFGTPVNDYTVSTNGFVQLFPDATGVGIAAGNNASTLPSATTPNGYLAPFWDDLKVPASGGNTVTAQTFGSVGSRHFTVEWANWAPAVDLSGRVTFQAQLYEATNTIEYHYCSMTTAGATMNVVNGVSATIGVENAAGTAGWAHSINTATVRTGLALRLLPN